MVTARVSDGAFVEEAIALDFFRDALDFFRDALDEEAIALDFFRDALVDEAAASSGVSCGTLAG